MKLNLPDIPALSEGEGHILVLGAGGGYDYLGAVPITHALQQQSPKDAVWVDIVKAVGMTGVQPLLKYLREQVDKMGIDTVVVVDGGVDALMRGDERGSGTLLEDAVTLTAVAQLDVPNKILMCMGFGTEAEEGLCHYRALENIAALAANGGFLGTCSLTPQMECFEKYKTYSEIAWEGKRKSHIHTRIIPAVMGQFGDQTMYEGVDARVCGQSKEIASFVNPLMGICWFFDLMKVYERNLFAKQLVPTHTRTDTLMIYRQNIPSLMKAPRMDVPIPL
jgi:hypothetical protein